MAKRKRKLPEGLRWRGNVIHYRFEINGTEYRGSCHTRDRDEALARLAEARAEAKQQQPTEERIALVKLAALDVAEHRARGCTERYADTLESKWAVVLRNLPPTMGPGQINFDAVNEYIALRRSQGVRGQTIIREVQCLKRATKIAERRHRIRAPREWPVVRRDPPDEKRKGKLRSPQEVLKWLRLLNPDAREEAEFIALTGIRWAEMKRARFDGIRPAPEGSPTTHVLDLAPEHTKTRRARTIGLPARAVEIAARRLQEKRGEDGRIFTSTDHKKHRAEMSQVALGARPAERPRNKRGAGRKKDYAKSSVPNITLRDLRHTFATLALQGTADATAVMNALGHTDLRTTQKYLSSTMNRTASAGAAVSEALFGKESKKLKSRHTEDGTKEGDDA
ncbi:MAG: tyrosine-type recombinase/integrase [Myxococcota bacterium]